jgi:hypothetical protein
MRMGPAATTLETARITALPRRLRSRTIHPRLRRVPADLTAGLTRDRPTTPLRLPLQGTAAAMGPHLMYLQHQVSTQLGDARATIQHESPVVAKTPCSQMPALIIATSQPTAKNDSERLF